METLSQLWSKIWHSISPEWRIAIFSGIIATVAAGIFTDIYKTLWARLKRLGSRSRKPEELPPPPPVSPPQQVEIKVTTAPPLSLPDPAPIEVAAPTPLIPPPPAVGFVARQDEDKRDLLETLKTALAPTSSQLVVIWGDGGHGKTTLAAEAARALKEAFKNRVVWISAERHADFSFSTLLDKIALISGRSDLLKLALEPKRAEVQALLSSAPTLLVLDNFETVAAVEQELCAEFLARGFPFPALITTREKLAGAKNISLEKMSPEEASELLERLIADADIEQAVAGLDRNSILEAADWNPLVMEWVVAQMMSDQPRDVLNELARGEGPAVRRVFDRSFNLPQLGDDGRDVLLALSLFVPSATREALAAVSGRGDDIKLLREAARKLMSLRLIRMTTGNERLFVSGLTRQLARIRLAEDPRADEFRQRFVAHFLSYAEAHAKTTREDFDALEAEKDNALNAMDIACDLSDWASVTRLMAAINLDGVNGFLTIRGYWDESIRRGEQALNAAHHLSFERQIAGFTHNLAIMYQSRGELTEARRLYNESLEIKKRLGDQSGIATTLHQLATLAQVQGELEEARRLYNESLEIEKRLGNQNGIAISLITLGLLAEREGDRVEAVRLMREALGIFERLKSPDAEIARRILERLEGEAS